MENCPERYAVKKFYWMLAIWFAAILIIITGSIIYDKFPSRDYDARALPYIKTAITEISQWDAEATRALMAAEVSAEIPAAQLDRVLARFSKLGALQSMAEPEVAKIHHDQNTIIGKQTVIEYNTAARYANGDAIITLKLVDRDGHFEIYHFNFSSQTLFE